MRQLLDLAGQSFGRLTVISREENNRWGSARWLCKCDCGKETTVDGGSLRSGATTSCGCFNRERSSERHKGNRHNWKGGRCIDANGYIWVKQPDHPNCMANGYIYEHRLVVEKILGRYLTKEENVHHEDEDRANNEPTNLRLFANSVEHMAYHRAIKRL